MSERAATVARPDGAGSRAGSTGRTAGARLRARSGAAVDGADADRHHGGRRGRAARGTSTRSATTATRRCTRARAPRSPHDPALAPFFPVFRAHPLLFQSIVSIGYQFGWGDWCGPVRGVVFGLATVLLVFELGRLVYGTATGLIAAAILAVMPYHVVVTRQVLLDGPQTFFMTLTLYLLARYARHAAYGLAVRRRVGARPGGAREGAGDPVLRRRLRVLRARAAGAAEGAPPPRRGRPDGDHDRAVPACDRAQRAQPKTRRQLPRLAALPPPEPLVLFYPSVVPLAIGLGVVAGRRRRAGLIRQRRAGTWRETLLVCWILVPAAFFELWPVKGFQYLLPIAPAAALLAAPARSSCRRCASGALQRVRSVSPGLPARGAPVRPVAWPAAAIRAVRARHVPGRLGRRAGRPRDGRLDPHERAGGRDHARDRPVDGQHRGVLWAPQGLRAVGSSNPLRPNPSYEPVGNPDRRIPQSDIQYLVWDAYSAARTKFFAARSATYASTFHGRVVYTDTVEVRRAAVIRVVGAGDPDLRGPPEVSAARSRCSPPPARGSAPRAGAPTRFRPHRSSHFVVLMQENHTFDNYFGTYPGADGPPKDVCMPSRSGDPSAGCSEPHPDR